MINNHNSTPNQRDEKRKPEKERRLYRGKDEKMRCKNCGHKLMIVEGTYKHAQSNHSMYCPCRKPEIS